MLRDFSSVVKQIHDHLGLKYVTLRLIEKKSNIISIENGKVCDVSSTCDVGAGIRVQTNRTLGFSSTTNLSRQGLIKAAREATKSAYMSLDNSKLFQSKCISDTVHSEKCKDWPIDEIIESCGAVQRDLMARNKTLSKISFEYSDSFEKRIYLDSNCSSIREDICLNLLTIMITSKRGGRYETAKRDIGYSNNPRAMLKFLNVVATETATEAVELLSSKIPKEIIMPLILDGPIAGAFIHEILGHAVEADNVLLGSFLKDQRGCMISEENLTVKDDPTLKHLFGSYRYDDEGTLGKPKTIVRNGVLKCFLHNKETAHEMHEEPTGNGRAQDYNCFPNVRMSNTYIQPKDWSFDEMIEDTDKGMYLHGTASSNIDITTGHFTFYSNHGHMIENGKLTKVLKSISISGDALECLKNVSAVGEELAFYPAQCVKDEVINVSCGAPHIRIEKIE